MQTRYDLRYQVKKFLGDVMAPSGRCWRVLTTGLAGWVMLRLVDEPGGMDLGIEVVRRRSDFRRGILPKEER